jgi:hypothetical protein
VVSLTIARGRSKAVTHSVAGGYLHHLTGYHWRRRNRRRVAVELSTVRRAAHSATLLPGAAYRQSPEQRSWDHGRATVSVAVVASRTEAELIVGLLRSHGVSAAVSADDAGGQYPQMQAEGVRVLVAPLMKPRPVGCWAPPMTPPTDEPVDQIEAQGRTRVPTRGSQVGDQRAPRRRPARGTGPCHRATKRTSTGACPTASST